MKYDKNLHDFIPMSVTSKALKAAVAAADAAYEAKRDADAKVAAIKSEELRKAGLIAGHAVVGRSKFTGEWQVMVNKGTTEPVEGDAPRSARGSKGPARAI